MVFAYMPTPGGLTGGPRRLLTLASVLREQGIEMCVVTHGNSELFKAAKELELQVVEAVATGVLAQRHGALFGGNAIFRLNVLVNLLIQNFGIARKIRKQGADAVWLRGSKGIAFAALGALLTRRPLVWDVDYELPSRGVVRWLHRFGLWAANRVVFQYSAAPDAIFGPELAARFRHKFQRIIPGIDLPSVEAFRLKRKAMERPADDPFVVLQVGTICMRKNQALLIDAVSRLRESRPNFRVRVQFAGGVYEEHYFHRLKETIDSEGLGDDVEFLGWRSDVHELMAGADLLAMPSRDEGVPNAVQEAMAIGLPVVVSAAGGMPEIVRHTQTGWVLPLNAPAEWATLVGRLVEDKAMRDEVGRNASSYAAARFGTAEWGRQYAAVILEASKADPG